MYYCFDRNGYVSKKIMLEYVSSIAKTIKMPAIDDLCRKNVARKKQLRGSNSFVAPGANYGYQIYIYIYTYV